MLWPEPAQNRPTWLWPVFTERIHTTAAGVVAGSCQWPARSPPLSLDDKSLSLREIIDGDRCVKANGVRTDPLDRARDRCQCFPGSHYVISGGKQVQRGFPKMDDKGKEQETQEKRQNGKRAKGKKLEWPIKYIRPGVAR